ncbi:MAG: MBL fold metallo-hydrolase [Alphaproteobacteria bacterium]|jgi:glyoxylase-like metal-dependent hydrolase (beta-lactamase superfamily II)|nr:MBL fold metallo-hydrolase [Alphaproteobacteria bacterium]
MQHGMGRMIGDIAVERIMEYEAPFFVPHEVFREATPEALAPHRHWLEPNAMDPETGKLILPFQSYLVRTKHHTILIDTCIGCGKNITHRPEWFQRTDQTWLNNLRAAGIEAEAIDYVFCTHLHADHCGWNTSFVDGRWVPTFPNAKYVFSKIEYAAAEARNDIIFRESALPIMEAGQAQLVETDFALDDNVWLQSTPGHTAGHVAVNLASNGHSAVMCGDLIHSPIQCVHPEWSPKFDLDKPLAAETRRNFLASNAESGQLVLTAHFPSPSMGHVVVEGDAFQFKYVDD